MGKYQKNEQFALRCPKCDPHAESIMAGLDLTKPYHAGLLGNIKTYKPAYARLLAGFHPLYQEALKSQAAPCMACGNPVEASMVHDPHPDKGSSRFGQFCAARQALETGQHSR